MEHAHVSEPATFPTLPSDLLAALRQPFAPEEVHLRAGQKRQTTEGAWQCVALPVVELRAYEARLDALVPGGWSSTSPSLAIAADRLVIAAHVQIGAIAHTDYAELPFKQASLLDEVEALIVSVPEAFEQAFVRACARFGLGRYLADLARAWVPYDATGGQIALAPEQQRTHMLKLYRQAGILRALPAITEKGASSSVPSEAPRETGDQRPERPLTSLEKAKARQRERNLAWVRERCAGKPLQSILRHFRLDRLEEISDADLVAVVNGTQRHKLQQAS